MSLTTRRHFLHAAASLTAIAPLTALRREPRQDAASRRILAYVGTYSTQLGPAPGRGQGIHILELNTATGALEPRDVVRTTSSPSWLAFDRGRTHLYAANEADTSGTGAGSVAAYSVDRTTGQLALLNSVSSGGAGPAHLSVHPTGTHVLVANYGGGTSAVLPIQADGRLRDPSDVKRHEGTPGSAQASSAPAGSFAISGHERPHAHMIEADAAGRFVLTADLGLDRILVWRFDAAAGTLTPNDPPSAPVPSGDGPRHFAFHPNGRWLYSLQEEASTIVLFDYDAANGRLRERQTISTLAKGFAGTNFTSEIVVAPGGRFVYAANRLHDSIAWFAIGADGRLTWGGEEWTRGDYPRSFTIEPAGRFLFSCNQRSDAIASFRVDAKSGRLTFTGQYTAVGSPAHIIFLG